MTKKAKGDSTSGFGASQAKTNSNEGIPFVQTWFEQFNDCVRRNNDKAVKLRELQKEHSDLERVYNQALKEHKIITLSGYQSLKSRLDEKSQQCEKLENQKSAAYREVDALRQTLKGIIAQLSAVKDDLIDAQATVKAYQKLKLKHDKKGAKRG